MMEGAGMYAVAVTNYDMLNNSNQILDVDLLIYNFCLNT